MADKITIKSGELGDRTKMPNLAIDELGYRTDTKALYIGTQDGNERLCGVDDLADTNSKIEAINTEINNNKAKISSIDDLLLTINDRLDAINTRLDALTPNE